MGIYGNPKENLHSKPLPPTRKSEKKPTIQRGLLLVVGWLVVVDNTRRGPLRGQKRLFDWFDTKFILQSRILVQPRSVRRGICCAGLGELDLRRHPAERGAAAVRGAALIGLGSNFLWHRTIVYSTIEKGVFRN